MKLGVVAGLALLAGTVTAAPTPGAPAPPPAKRGGRGPVFLPIKKLAAPKQRRSLEGRALEGRAELLNWNRDYLYNVEVGLGTPPQKFSLSIDTGSPVLWVMGKECNTSACSTQPLFDGNASSTFKDEHTPMAIGYGSGDVTGHWAQDTVSFDTVTEENQDITVVNHTVVELLKDYKTQGLLGLSWAGRYRKPVWQRVFESDMFETKTFSVYLERDLRPKDVEKDGYTSGPGGQFVMGGYNHEIFEGNLNWAPYVNRSRTFWTVRADGIRINDVELKKAKDNVVVLDTATTFSFGNIGQVREFYEQIPGVTNASVGGVWQYTFPCDAVKNLDVNWKFNGVEYPMYAGDLIATQEGNNCTGAIQGVFILRMLGVSGVDWLLGANFLKNVYTSYRMEPPSVGFARLKDEYNNRRPEYDPSGGVSTAEPTTELPEPTAEPSATESGSPEEPSATESGSPEEPSATESGSPEEPSATSSEESSVTSSEEPTATDGSSEAPAATTSASPEEPTTGTETSTEESSSGSLKPCPTDEPVPEPDYGDAEGN